MDDEQLDALLRDTDADLQSALAQALDLESSLGEVMEEVARCSDVKGSVLQSSSLPQRSRPAVNQSSRYDHERRQSINIDALIVERVQQAGEGSREYFELSATLLEVGVGTLTNLSKNNLLFPALRQRQIKVPRPPPEAWPKDAARVIYLSVRKTVPKFMHRQVLNGGWDPTRGTTLKTFFVTASLYGFATEYRIYYKEEIGGHHLKYCVDDVALVADHDLKYGPGSPENPESTAVDRDTLRRLLPPDTDPDFLTILVRSSQHFTQKEIADELGVSEEAITSRIRRFRRRGRPMIL